MAEANQQETPQGRLKILTAALAAALQSGGMLAHARNMLNSLHPAEIAHLLESMPPQERLLAWELVDPELDGEVLSHLSDEVRPALLRLMDTHELIAATEGLATDDMADILQDLPQVVIQTVLQSMNVQDRQRVESVLSYPEDTAGGLMNTDTLTVRPDVTLDVVLRYLRLRGEIPETTDSLIVVTRADQYIGLLSLADLLTRDPELTVGEVMEREVEGIPATMAAIEVANLFEQRDLISAPVIDDEGKLLGRITIDDVVDVIRDEAEHSVMSMAGLREEEDIFAPVVASAQRRAVWLGINLVTAFLASWVIGLFEATIEKIVALAVLMPIVASMGGIAGTQTATLVIRGMALGRVGAANARRVVMKELAVGALNSMLWAVVVAVVALVWYQDWRIGAIIAAAMVINLLTAALTGTTLPLLLRKMGADPALAGSVILTTFTDVVGFLAFLGLATVFLM
ncbi:MAG: magnesium transporter [Gammaproteobacteria bacterium]|nr:magnesium transporter [Gammaproteobacteria bacterium]